MGNGDRNNGATYVRRRIVLTVVVRQPPRSHSGRAVALCPCGGHAVADSPHGDSADMGTCWPNSYLGDGYAVRLEFCKSGAMRTSFAKTIDNSAITTKKSKATWIPLVCSCICCVFIPKTD